MGYCRKCPDCDSNLDPNEKCDCQNKDVKEAKDYDKAGEKSNNEKAS